MEDFVQEYLQMFDEGKKIGENFKPPEISLDKISNIVVCGMGGSGVCGDILIDMTNLNIPIIVVKDYKVPKFVDERSLVFCISYSGNTEENLSQLIEAKKRGSTVISITSGGKMKEWSQKIDIPSIILPCGFHPRDSFLLIMIPMLSCLEKMGLGKFSDNFVEIREVIKKIDIEKLDVLAEKIKNSKIAVYGTSNYIGVLAKIKNDFNENSKMAIMHGFFPEMNHNEINGYQRKDLVKDVDVIMIRDNFETEEMKTRIEVTKGILKNYANSINEIWTLGESKMARTTMLVLMSTYITSKVADLVGIDRNKVPFVDRMKVELKEKLNLVERMEKNL